MNLLTRRFVSVTGLLVVVLVTGTLVLLLPPSGRPAITPDSIYYLMAGQSLAQGHGLRFSNFSLFDPHYVAYTTWPPLYPLLLSTGIAPLWIQAGLMAGIAALLYALLTKAGKVHAVVAVFFTLIITLIWPLLMDASYVWSELFAQFWIMLSLFFLGSFLTGNGSRRSLFYWFLAVLAVACAFYTRYASLVFIPGLMLALLGAPFSWPRRWLLIMATPIAAGLLVFPLLLRNYLLTSSISGAIRPYSIWDAGIVFRTIISYIGWSFGSAGWARAIYVICLIGILFSCLVYLVDRRRMDSRQKTEGASDAMRVTWMAAAYAMAYIIGIGGLRIWRHFDLSVRMVSPATPLVLLALLLCAVMIWRGVPVIWQRMILVLPFAGVVLLAGLASWQMGNRSWRTWRHSGFPGWPMTYYLFYTNLKPLTLPKVSGIVLSTTPKIMAFRSNWEFRRIPRHAESPMILSRIAREATGVVVNNRTSERLALALKPVVPDPRFFRLQGALVLIWGKPQAGFDRIHPVVPYFITHSRAING